MITSTFCHSYFRFSSKPWSMPVCVFFTTFTLVMTLLILATNLSVERHYIDFNSSNIWDFEEYPQNEDGLINLISSEFIQAPPINYTLPTNFSGKPSEHIFNLFHRKRNGVFLECGSGGHGDTEWLETVLNWRGLLTQPHPDSFVYLQQLERSRSHLAQVCISPTIYPKHAFFRQENKSLIAVPCFPLFSLMKAYNSSNFDFLSLNEDIVPFHVLKALPVGKVMIKMISIKNPEIGKTGVYENICCDPSIVNLLDKWGYKVITSCINPKPACYFVCSSSKNYCPSL